MTRRKRVSAVAAAGVAGWWLTGAVTLTSQTAGQPPTFNANVAAILYEHCVSCHRTGEMAPMSLMTYVEARPWARAIKEKVLTRQMPPWFADPAFGRFRNARALPQDAIDTLVAWADDAAPEGTGRAPARPRFPERSSGFMDRPPDLVLRMPVEIEIPARGEPPYVKLWTRLPFGRDVLIEAVELRPGNRRVTHHSSAGVMPLPAGAEIRTGAAWPGGPAVRDAVALLPNGDPAVGGVVTGNVLVFYVPGGGYQRFRPGTARRIRGNDLLLWSVHYMPTGVPEKDRHTLAVWLAKEAVTHEVVTAAASEVHIVEGREVVSGDDQLLAPIPANAARYERTGIIPFREPVTLYGLWPHMHNYGKDMTFVAVYPDGREQLLLSVPRYDPAWQIQYELADPLKLPAGSSIRATAHYDNSAGNRRSLAPGKEVEWGLQSWNEMFGPFLDLVYDARRLPPLRRPDLFTPECDPVGRGTPQDPAGVVTGGLFGRPCP